MTCDMCVGFRHLQHSTQYSVLQVHQIYNTTIEMEQVFFLADTLQTRSKFLSSSSVLAPSSRTSRFRKHKMLL